MLIHRRLLVALAALVASGIIGLSSASAAPVTLAGEPAPISWGNGHMDVFVQGSDNALWHRAFVQSLGGWGPWQSLGGGITSMPAAVSWGPNHLDVFARGTDGQLWHRWFDGSGWYPWAQVGTWTIQGEPAPMSWGSNHIDVFARGGDNTLIHIPWVPICGGWCNWSRLGGGLSATPRSISWGSGHIDTFIRGTDSQLWHRWYGAAGWSNWEQLGSWQMASRPEPMTWGNGHVAVFARGLDNALIANSFVASLCGWCGWASLGGVLTSTPHATTWGTESIEAFARGTDNGLWRRSFSGGSRGGSGWSDWQALGRTDISSAPRPVSWGDGHLDVYARDTAGELVHRAYVNGGWLPWENLGAPGPYPTSATYGGANLSVDTQAETDQVIEALQADDDATVNQLWDGLLPGDQSTLRAAITAAGTENPGASTDGGSSTDEPGDAADAIDAEGNPTGPPPAYERNINDHDIGLCSNGRRIYPVPHEFGALVTSKVSFEWLDQGVINGREWVKIRIEAETLSPWRPWAKWVGAGWVADDPRPGTNTSSPFNTSTVRDRTRDVKMPFYYHTSAVVWRGTVLRYNAKVRHAGIPVAVGDNTVVLTYGANFPGSPKIWEKCRVDNP